MIDWYEVVERYNQRHETDYNDEQDLLNDLYSGNLAIADIADELILANSTVRLRMKKYNIERRRKKKKEKTDKELLEIYNNGGSTKQMARKAGYNVESFRNRLRKLGIKFLCGKEKRVSDEVLMKIVNESENRHEAAVKLGYTYDHLVERIKKSKGE